MSLDIAVLGDDQRVLRSVPIGVDDHAVLMSVVVESKLRILGRLSDYYEDAEIFPAEFDDLGSELSAAVSQCDPGSTLHSILLEIERLVSFARAQSRSIVALAD